MPLPRMCADLEQLAEHGTIDALSIQGAGVLTSEVARGFGYAKSVRRLWIWCSVERAALAHILRIPGLCVLDILALQGGDLIDGFESANALSEFRCNNSLTFDDAISLTKSYSLREIGIQGCPLTFRLFDHFAKMPLLRSIDLEGARFTDDMARRICRVPQLESLDLGHARLSRRGLENLCTMTTLRSLDVWATRIHESDLHLLRRLPNLEYLSIGPPPWASKGRFDADRVLRILRKCPNLKQLWLDGISATGAQQHAFNTCFDRVQFTQ